MVSKRKEVAALQHKLVKVNSQLAGLDKQKIIAINKVKRKLLYYKW